MKFLSNLKELPEVKKRSYKQEGIYPVEVQNVKQASSEIGVNI